jgi:glycosyltransferase involved in cell wall biosynthesis
LKKKVALLIFNPFTNDSRVLKEAISLANNNYAVEIIAHHDKNLKKTETYKNFLIKRFSYLDRSVTKNKIKKVAAYIKYIKESAVYCKDFDILHCNDLNTLPIALIIKKIYNKNIKVIYDAHEYETETNGLHGIQKSLTKVLERFLIKYANKVITVSNAIADEYVKLYDIQKPSLVLNTPSYKTIIKKDLFRTSLDIKKDQTIFLYQGGLSSGRGIEIILDTFKQMDDDKKVVVFMGYGPMENMIKLVAQTYKNIYFHQAVDPNILLDYTSSTDFGISTIEDSCLSYKYCLPNKMFEYIMAEIPIIVSNLPEMKKIVEDHAVGIVTEENTPDSLKKAINKALKLEKSLLKTNIQKLKAIYNWEEQEKVLLQIYSELNR